MKKELKIHEELSENDLKEWKEKYETAKKKYIDKYESYDPGGFLFSGSYKANPAKGLKEWERYYPNGFDDWLGSLGVNFKVYLLYLNTIKDLVDTVNELIVKVNNKK